MENIKEWVYEPGVKMKADITGYKLHAVYFEILYLNSVNVRGVGIIWM